MTFTSNSQAMGNGNRQKALRFGMLGSGKQMHFRSRGGDELDAGFSGANVTQLK